MNPSAYQRGPTQDELFTSLWGNAGPNNQDGATGYKWFPLPAKAPAAEWTFFVFPKSAKTELEVADLLIKSYYEDDCNEVADKRREICHFLSRSGEPNEKELTALKHELQVLLAKVGNKGKVILDRTGYAVDIPRYFAKFPALEG
ncbi:hypothetical protein ACQ4PT_026679 [Festuca glaucescens]